MKTDRIAELLTDLPSAPKEGDTVNLSAAFSSVACYGCAHRRELEHRVESLAETMALVGDGPELDRLRRLESVTHRFRSALEGCAIAPSNQVEAVLAELDEVLNER